MCRLQHQHYTATGTISRSSSRSSSFRKPHLSRRPICLLKRGDGIPSGLGEFMSQESFYFAGHYWGYGGLLWADCLLLVEQVTTARSFGLENHDIFHQMFKTTLRSYSSPGDILVWPMTSFRWSWNSQIWLGFIHQPPRNIRSVENLRFHWYHIYNWF